MKTLPITSAALLIVAAFFLSRRFKPSASGRLSIRGRQHLRDSEGVRLKAYDDAAGLPTIGIGHLITVSEHITGQIMIDGKAVSWRSGLTVDQVEALFVQDLRVYEQAVSEQVKVTMTQGQYDALVSFVFNVGVSAFSTSTLLSELNRGNYANIPDQFRRWTKAGGKELAGLKTRREREVQLWYS